MIAQMYQLALQHHQAGRLREAEPLYRQILARQPDHADALHQLGFLSHQMGLNSAALPLLNRAIAINAQSADYQVHLAMVLSALGQSDEAIAALERAATIEPNDPEPYFHLGNGLLSRGRIDDAIGAYQHSAALGPGVVVVYNNLAAALKLAGRLEESIATYREALKIRPDFAEAHNNLGGVLQELGRFEPAMVEFKRALALRPNFPEARMSVALALLVQGDFKRGWQEYEARRELRKKPGEMRFSEPYWNGSDPAGRRILLRAEQGFGDTIQFIRYAPLIAAKGAHVIVHAPPELRRLLATVRGVSRVVCAGDAIEPVDAQCLLMSLPRILGTTLETIPASVPYVAPDPALAEHWRGRMSGRPPGLKVGLVWAGGAHNKSDRTRSLSLAALAPLTRVPGVQFYSLQKGAAARQARTPPAGFDICDWTDDLGNFADTAALAANLDLVISVDTAVAHLAGAMGLSVWLALPFVPDFRWLLNRNDSPWYPTMRLFRQARSGDWDGVIAGMAEALGEIKRKT